MIFWNTPFDDTQRNTISQIIDFSVANGVRDLRKVSYMLGTAYLECTLKPIEEYDGANAFYGQIDPETGQRYYGRGFVQITYKVNYQKFANILNIDLVNHPELALQPAVATAVLVLGMRDGLFTTRGMGEFFNDVTTDPVNARTIVNGMDKADLIAGYYTQFLNTVLHDKIPYPF